MHEHENGTIMLSRRANLGEITMCGCGVVSLHLGTISVRLEGTALVQLDHLIQAALDCLCELKVQQATANHAMGPVH